MAASATAGVGATAALEEACWLTTQWHNIAPPWSAIG